MLGDVMALRVGLVLVLILVVSAGLSRLYVYGADESDAAVAIAEAKEKIVVCYGAVAEADAAGANVTVLLDRLNGAGEFLSKAKLSYSQGDFDSAAIFADQSQAVLDGFVGEAEALTEKVGQVNYLGFVVVAGSAVGALGVVCGGFAAWLLLKKRGETGGVAE